MKIITTFVPLILSICAMGQVAQQSEPTSEFKRVLFGVNISPDYCYRTLENNDGSATSSAIIDLRNQDEQFKIGYTAGLNICYNLSRKLGLELGAQYSNKGYAMKQDDLTFGDLIDPRYGFVYNTSTTNGTSAPVKAKFIFNHIYLDVPIRAIYSFGVKRVHLFTSVGVTTNISLKATQTNVLELENGETKRENQDQQENFKSINVSPSVSLGVDYEISKKLNLRAEPTFRYGLLKIIDAPITAYLWSGGLNMSCYYTIK